MAWDFTVDSDIQLEMSKTLKQNADELDVEFGNLYAQLGPSNLGTHWVGEDYNTFNTGCEGYRNALKDMTDTVRMYATHFEKVAEGTDVLCDACVSIVQNMTTRGDALPGAGGSAGNNGGSTGNNGGSADNNGGSAGNNAGSTGNNGGSKGNAGLTGNNGGSTGNNTGSTGNNGGSTGNNTGSTGNNGGSTGNNAGLTGNNAGSTGNNAGSTGNNGGSTGNNAGLTGNNAGSTGNNGGSTGNNAGSTANNGGSTGNNAGSTGNNAGSTGNNAGSTGNNAGSTGNSGQNGTGGSRVETYFNNLGGRYIDDYNDFKSDVGGAWENADGLVSGVYALARTGHETAGFLMDTTINTAQGVSDITQSVGNFVFDLGDTRSVDGEYWSNIKEDYAENFDFSTCDNFVEGAATAVTSIPRTLVDIGQTGGNAIHDAFEVVGDFTSDAADALSDGVSDFMGYIFD